MNILVTPDILEWAIGNLTRAITKAKCMQRFNFFTVPVHPRGTTEAYLTLDTVVKKGVDFWHAQYWHSAENVLNDLPMLKLKDVPKLLTHHNHYALDKRDWREKFDGLAIATRWGFDKLKTMHDYVYQIPYGIDLDRYPFIQEYPPEGNNVGYIGRVLPHKNLKIICEVSKELGYKVIGSGYVEDQDYWRSFNHDNLDYKGNIGRQSMSPSNVKDDLYKKMKVFVAYSTGEKETGTLPLLEAMARGFSLRSRVQSAHSGGGTGGGLTLERHGAGGGLTLACHGAGRGLGSIQLGCTLKDEPVGGVGVVFAILRDSAQPGGLFGCLRHV
jgi:glycosyltransferase involved in cell wall biosynthesis